MPTTRSRASGASSSPAKPDDAQTGDKRSASQANVASSPARPRAQAKTNGESKSKKPKQMKIDDTPGGVETEDKDEDDTKDEKKVEKDEEVNDKDNTTTGNKEESEDKIEVDEDEKKNDDKEKEKDVVKETEQVSNQDLLDAEKGVEENDKKSTEPADKTEPKSEETKTETKAQNNADDSAIDDSAREKSTPSAILEKGLIYFFFRSRVGIEHPSSVADIARSYIVLRPIPHGAAIDSSGGAVDDSDTKTNRLLALPKKVLPKSGRDQFMVFVEKAGIPTKEIKDETFASSDYDTKTAGARHAPSATPLAEGVYAITSTGRESHLVYMLTIPESLSEVQQDMGLSSQGSFVISTKNPTQKGPSYASLPQGPEFPKDIVEEFASLRWKPTEPKHLDYANCQILLIGNSGNKEGDIAKATNAEDVDGKQDGEGNKDTPLEELEKLEREDADRIEHLKGDDSIFEDLGMRKKEFKSVASSW